MVALDKVDHTVFNRRDRVDLTHLIQFISTQFGFIRLIRLKTLQPLLRKKKLDQKRTFNQLIQQLHSTANDHFLSEGSSGKEHFVLFREMFAD